MSCRKIAGGAHRYFSSRICRPGSTAGRQTVRGRKWDVARRKRHQIGVERQADLFAVAHGHSRHPSSTRPDTPGESTRRHPAVEPVPRPVGVDRWIISAAGPRAPRIVRRLASTAGWRILRSRKTVSSPYRRMRYLLARTSRDGGRRQTHRYRNRRSSSGTRRRTVRRRGCQGRDESEPTDES